MEAKKQIKKTNISKKSQTKGKNKSTAIQKSPMRVEIFILASFSIAVLCFLSNFHLCGVVGDFLRGVQLGLFGMLGYITPILLFVATCYILANKENIHAMKKMIVIGCALIFFCSLLQFLFAGGIDNELGMLEHYRFSTTNGLGGGLVGGILLTLLEGMLGRIGAFIVLLILFVICIVYVTEKSVIGAVQKHSANAYQYAKHDFEKRKEERLHRTSLKQVTLEEKKELENIKKKEKDCIENPIVNACEAPEVTDNEFNGVIEAPESYLDIELAEDEAGRISNPLSQVKILEEPIQKTVEYTYPASEIIYDESKTIKNVKDEATTSEIERALQQELQQELQQMETAMTRDTAATEIVDSLSNKKEEAIDNLMEETIRDDAETVVQREGSNFDKLRMLEEQKRVVTTTGKVMETDTEILQKKLEQKREEANIENDIHGRIQFQEEDTQVPLVEYLLPPLELLKRGKRNNNAFSESEYRQTALKLQNTLRNFGVGVTVTNISCGPTVTRYELQPEQGVKVSKIVSLADDIKLNLAAEDIRIEAPIPGKAAVGIEVPNKVNNVVYLRELFEVDAFKNHESNLAFAVGKDIGGQVVTTDIAKMPHLLIAGATGSGKSVCINTLIMSILFKAHPDDVKLIMIDPKVVELSVYNGIPHLMIPVVTDPKKASGALNWAVVEMTERYKKFAEYNVRDLKGYNKKVESIEEIEDENKPKKLPQLVIIVDELADLMMVSPGEVEDSICRLAQLARAAGIHLVIATQRPSVNVITGLIKANVPSRIAFSVSSGVDSRTIIDMNGAEKLLGKGDMLFYPAGYPKPQRVQGAFVSDKEVQSVVEFLAEQGIRPNYDTEVEKQVNSNPVAESSGSSQNGMDEYFEAAGRFVIEKEKGSIGMLQRMFKIGFNRAARIMDQLAQSGVVGEEEGTKPRKILMTIEEFEELIK